MLHCFFVNIQLCPYTVASVSTYSFDHACGCDHLQGQRDVEVHWHPFQLNPNAPKEGINKLQYYQAKFGPERTAQMIPRMIVRDAMPMAIIDTSAFYSLQSLC